MKEIKSNSINNNVFFLKKIRRINLYLNKQILKKRIDEQMDFRHFRVELT